MDKKASRILFVGNSITWHPVKEEIGWMNEWGMAASCEENDYVHQLMKKVKSINPDAQHKVAWAVAWEREYWDAVHLVAFKEYLNFEPDIIIIKIGENVSAEHNDEYPYEHYYKSLIDYINPEQKSKVIICTGFWKRGVIDDVVRKTALGCGYPLIELNHLDIDEMKAHDTYGNSAPANHPGDRGMGAIADEIFAQLKEIL